MSDMVYSNGTYEIWEREYETGYFVYDLKSCKTGEIYKGYSFDLKKTEEDARWFAYN